MKEVVILSGVSGVGKTHFRLHTPELASLPCLDIADIHAEFPELDYAATTGVFLKRLRKLLEEHDRVVVEAYFLSGSPSLNALLDDLTVIGARWQLIRLHAPLEVCQERIMAQMEAGEITPQVAAARLKLLARTWKRNM